ncbi:hypothetical protein K402DRAFT_416609 [Aulographum hederae CBS 113979]|uniref:Transcription initiation factor TFIID subunit 2 n=1 Tax=Aulographum hederae CBS 113979 TaxID=1176131 RepID=A0A6G1HGE3_9PEZI|nr:hypothetical protein K402DRAFT_416609 [Aulographum hederae CBS 113979]
MTGQLEPEVAQPTAADFTVSSQAVELDVEFLSRTVKGKTEIVVQPAGTDLRIIRLNCRQCVVTAIKIQGKPVPIPKHKDPYTHLGLRSEYETVFQHHQCRERIEGALGTTVTSDTTERELSIPIPKSVRISALDPASAAALQLAGNGAKDDGNTTNTLAGPAVLAGSTGYMGGLGVAYTPVKIEIEFRIDNVRDGLHFVGLREDDGRYPHAYTRNSGFPGTTCCIFPCVDQLDARCTWDISIRCPRTLGDAVRKPAKIEANGAHAQLEDTADKDGEDSMDTDEDEQILNLALGDEEKALDFTVVCSGDMTDDIVDPLDPTKRTVSFSCSTPISAHQIGFAIGPFEHVDLSEFREIDQDERLGQSAVRVDGYCLPRRSEEVRSTCMAQAAAMDFYVLTYTSYPFSSYSMVFVDDMDVDVANAASVSLCASRLLYPEEVLDTMDYVTIELARALAAQWSGIYIIPLEPKDHWILIGGAGFMADHFSQSLMGKNEYRFRRKMAADRVLELDIGRPSLHSLGDIIDLDPAELELIKLKAPLVLFILHQRIIKAMGRNGVPRILSKMFQNAKTGDLQNAAISTQVFLRTCEKIGHSKLDQFFFQWVYGSGYPIFHVTQTFNKKKMNVELRIDQVQRPPGKDLRDFDTSIDTTSFLRRTRESNANIQQSKPQHIFTESTPYLSNRHTPNFFQGPMTVRIHEADGTPYEHIIDIRESRARFELSFNTKYKRLKRVRRQKERAAAAAGIVDTSGDVPEDQLLYCLGDVLQSDREIQEWGLKDWSEEEEAAMNSENFEWLRVDKDFEWICRMTVSQPKYMWVSQLQQENDVVAQVESLQYLMRTNELNGELLSTILVRTLYDSRYYHGIRTMAAGALARCARIEFDYIGLKHLEKVFEHYYCIQSSTMTKSNDFSDRRAYVVQCAIPLAMCDVRTKNGKVLMRVKRFLLDKLKYNDNSNNEFSDCGYVTTLMRCLARTLVVDRQNYTAGYLPEDNYQEEMQFQEDALNEIERWRRKDEWLSSYRNIYSTTAISCLLLLMQNKVIPRSLSTFVQYSRPTNADNVRLQAFESLVELGVFEKANIMRFILHSYFSDKSPYLRGKLWNIIWRGLAHVAFGDFRAAPETDPAQELLDGALIVERDVSLEERQLAIARKKTLEGALDALKNDLSSNEVLQDYLRKAMSSREIGLREFVDILDLCQVLYDTFDKLVVSLKYPRYYTATNLGQGKIALRPNGRVRTTPMPKIEPLLKLHPPGKAAKGPSPSLKRQRQQSTVGSPERPFKQRRQSSTPDAHATSSGIRAPTPAMLAWPPDAIVPSTSNGTSRAHTNAHKRDSKVVKLKIKDKSRLAKFHAIPSANSAAAADNILGGASPPSAVATSMAPPPPPATNHHVSPTPPPQLWAPQTVALNGTSANKASVPVPAGTPTSSQSPGAGSPPAGGKVKLKLNFGKKNNPPAG